MRTRSPLFLPATLVAASLFAASLTPTAAGSGFQERSAALESQAPALTRAQEDRAQRLEGRLKCPVCRTQSVRESTSFMALEMRAKIRELIEAGRGDREILQYFVDRYGDYILLEPRRRGFGLSAYLLPLVAVLGGAMFLLLRARQADRRAAAAIRTEPAGGGGRGGEPVAQPPPGGAERLSPADRERVDEELKRYTV